ncbi:MAG: hypothetical protein AAF547_01895 [Actinomycetota bacterium]
MISGNAIDIQAVSGPGENSGVAGGDLIADFVEAVLADDRAAIADSRSGLMAELGAEAVVDIAAVTAMFTVMNRVADATGTPVDRGPAEPFVRQVADELGLVEEH